MESLRDAFPAAIAVHGVITAVYGCDLPRVVLAHLLLQLLEVACAICGQRVPPVHEGMHENAVHALLLRHFEQRVKMRLLRVHAAVGDQPEEVQTPAAASRMLHGRRQRRVRKELAILNHQIDARDVHVHDPARANIQVPDFTISHLPFRQTDKRTAGMNQGIGILAQQAIVGRLARQRDGIGFGFRAVPPAVEDDEDERFGAGHESKLAPGF